jgi:hypothetical protein
MTSFFGFFREGLSASPLTLCGSTLSPVTGLLAMVLLVPLNQTLVLRIRFFVLHRGVAPRLRLQRVIFVVWEVLASTSLQDLKLIVIRVLRRGWWQKQELSVRQGRVRGIKYLYHCHSDV